MNKQEEAKQKQHNKKNTNTHIQIGDMMLNTQSRVITNTNHVNVKPKLTWVTITRWVIFGVVCVLIVLMCLLGFGVFNANTTTVPYKYKVEEYKTPANGFQKYIDTNKYTVSENE